jgi:cytochrome c
MKYAAFAFLAVTIVVVNVSCDRKSDEQVSVSNEKPEENRFTPVTVTQAGSLNEPMMFQVLSDTVAYIIERHGNLKKINLTDKSAALIGNIPVFTENEQGLIGFILDPGFRSNRWAYIYYAHAAESKFVLSRFELRDSLIKRTEKILLQIPCDRGNTSHTGGGMTWDRDGNLYLTTGNNTGNSLYSQTDQRADRKNFDDQRGAANTNDLRGKILRIHPEPNGSYSIAEGNLFKKGTEGARPEIFVMGNRNPWRIHVDSKTGYVYWGEIGPDADSDTENGPMGYDELNQAKEPGFFGWPYFIGENQGYPMYDYVKGSPGTKQDPAHPVNNSVNNTGLKNLPPAQPAFIAYPYRSSEKYPLVGSSSRCAIGGPVYRRSDFKNPLRPYPGYYEGKWLAADLSRFWIMAITMDENGDYKSMERFLPDYHPQQPIDIKFGPQGDLYVLEYGTNTVNSASESKLVRIEYNAGNRKPIVNITSNKRGGAVPLSLELSAKGTVDYDGDSLTYDWRISGPQNFEKRNAGPVYTADLMKPGTYEATVTVRDDKGLENTNSVKIIAGNEPPMVQLNLDGNQDFFFANNAIHYDVQVADKEDGSLKAGTIKPDQVSLTIDYVSAGFDYVDVTLGHAKVDAATRNAVAETMISRSDCKSCHHVDAVGVGPSFTKIAHRYKGRSDAPEYLAGKILKGSAGVWGKEAAMPAHPDMHPADVRAIANYILGISTSQKMKAAGTFITTVPRDDKGTGKWIIRAAYTDHPKDSLPGLSTERVQILRAPIIQAVDADHVQGLIRDHLDEYTFLTARKDSYIVLKNIDLTNVKQIQLIPNWHLYDIYKGAKVSLRVDKVDGNILAETDMLPEQFNMRYRGAFGGLDDKNKMEQVKKRNLPVLDESAFFARGSDKNEFTIPSILPSGALQGRHDLYFVFTNDSADAKDALVPLARIAFSNESPLRKK